MLRSSLAALTPTQSAALDYPIAWAEGIAGLTLDPWQRDALLPPAPPPPLIDATERQEYSGRAQGCLDGVSGRPCRGFAVARQSGFLFRKFARHLVASDASFRRETMTEVEPGSGGLAVSPPAIAPTLRGLSLRHDGPAVPIVDEAVAQIAAVLETGRGFSTEHQLLRMKRNGRFEDTYWIYSFAPLHDRGAVVGVFVTALDTTAQVVAERRLREEQQRQRQMLRQMPGFVAMLSGPDLVYSYVNDAYVEIAERTDFVGRRFRDVFAEIEGQGFFEAFETAFRSGESIVSRGMELRLHGRDETQYVDFVLEPIRDGAGVVTGLFVGGYETTEIYRGTEALRRSEARLAFLDKLSGETAPLADADAVLGTTTRLLGEHLNLSICAYADMDEDEDGFTIRGDWAAPGSRASSGTIASLISATRSREPERRPAARGQRQPQGARAPRGGDLPEHRDRRHHLHASGQGRPAHRAHGHPRPRPPRLDQSELNLLREVTARSWAHVERVGVAAELRATEERLRLAVDNAEVGFWDVDLVNDVLIWPNSHKGDVRHLCGRAGHDAGFLRRATSEGPRSDERSIRRDC